MLCRPARKIRLTSGSTPQTCTTVMNAIAQRPPASQTCGSWITWRWIRRLLSRPLSGSKTRRQSTPLTTDGSAHGQHQDREHDAAPGEDAPQRDRDEDAEHELERDGEQHVLHRVAHGVGRRRVVEHLPVVAQPDVALRLAELARGLDALLEAPDERIDDQPADRGHGRQRP